METLIRLLRKKDFKFSSYRKKVEDKYMNSISTRMYLSACSYFQVNAYVKITKLSNIRQKLLNIHKDLSHINQSFGI